MKWKKNRCLYLTLMIGFGFFYSCEKETIKPIKVETASFSKDIVPIFTKNCIGIFMSDSYLTHTHVENTKGHTKHLIDLNFLQEKFPKITHERVMF